MPILDEREDRVLNHVARYRLSTPAIIHRLYFAPDNLPVAATQSTLTRLRNNPTLAFLRSQKLYGTGRDVYYHLTERGAAYLGLPPSIGHGFDNLHVRAQYLGQLLFSCGRIQRPKFTAAEFEHVFPGLLEPGTELRKRFFSDAYFLDETDAVRRLGRILVDTSGDMLKVMEKALAVATVTLAPFVRARRFTLAVVFPTHAKLGHFRYLLRQTQSLDAVHVILDAQPALLPLLATAL